MDWLFVVPPSIRLWIRMRRHACGVQDFDATAVLKLMETLMSIAYEDRQKCLTLASSQHDQATSSQLEHLICSLQSRLLSWCQQQLADDVRHRDDESRLIVQAVVTRCTHDKIQYHWRSIISCDCRTSILLLAASAIRLLPPVAHTVPPAYDVRPLGLLCDRPSGVELTAWLSARSYTPFCSFSHDLKTYLFSFY